MPKKSKNMEGLFVEFKPQMGKRGRPHKYKPQELLDKFQEYLDERRANPIVWEESEEGKSGQSKFGKTRVQEHPQLISVADFCIYLGCSRNWWNELGEEYLGVKDTIKTYIDNFQLKGATVGVFNGNIVSRLLGLKDKTDIAVSGNGVKVYVQSEDERKKIENIGKIEEE